MRFPARLGSCVLAVMFTALAATSALADKLYLVSS